MHSGAGTPVSHLTPGVQGARSGVTHLALHPAACLFDKHTFVRRTRRASVPNSPCFNVDKFTLTRSIHGSDHASFAGSLFEGQINGVAMLSCASKVHGDLY